MSSSWTLIVFAVAFVFLWRGTYSNIEKLVAVLVGVFSLSVVVGLVLIQGTEFRITSEQVLSGLTFSFGKQDVQLAAIAVVSLMGALGATGNELFMYPYWILAKGYAQHVGPPGDEGWLARAKGWVRVLQVDVFVSTALATLTTLGYFLIGGAVLYGVSEELAGDDIIQRLSAMYTNTYGGWSKGLFLAGALCTLFSTLIVGTAAFARMWCDMLASYGWLNRENPKSWQAGWRTVQSLYLVAFLAIIFTVGQAPVKLVVFGQYISGAVCTPLLMIAICWMAFRTDKRVRMNKVTAVLLVTSVVLIGACVIGSVILQVTGKS